MEIRKADLGKPDLAARTVPVVLATDYPVQRFDYLEVLDSSKADLSRGDLPLIESHDHQKLNIGVVRNIRPEAGKLRGDAVFGTSARADEVLADVQAGIVTGVSIGYELTDTGEPITLPDGRPARRFGFMPFEVSAVSVPADPNAGFNRSHAFKSQGKPVMETTLNRNHAAEIAEIAATIPGGPELAIRSLQMGHTVDQFQQEAIKHLSTKPLRTDGPARETRQQPETANRPVVLRSAEDFRRHYGSKSDIRPGVDSSLTLSDFMRAVAGMNSSGAAQRTLQVGINTAGGYSVPNILMPGILEAMVPVSSLLQAGAGVVPLDGPGKTFSFAAVDFLPVAYWRNENGQVQESEPSFRKIDLTPRSLSFTVPVSRELLQDGVNMEDALRITIAQAFAKEMDRAGLVGAGVAPEILGLAGTPGVQEVTNGANGATLSGYANIFSGVQKILEESFPMPTAAIMAPRSLVRLGALVDSTGQPLQVPQMLQPIKMIHSASVPTNLTVGTSTDCSNIFIGDFTKFIFGMREQVSIELMRESRAAFGQVEFMCHARLDVAVLYPKAFTVVKGVR